MKNDLTCGVVRDLLPLFLEKLTRPETDEAIKRHLQSCPDCTAYLQRLDQPVPNASGPAADEAAQVDYLRGVRRRWVRRVVAAVAVTMALIALLLGVCLFCVGRPAGTEGVAWQISWENGRATLQFDALWSGDAYWDWQVTSADNGLAWTVTARRVLASPLHRDGGYTVSVPIPENGVIYFGDTVIWQAGVTVEPETLHLLEYASSYDGTLRQAGAMAQAFQLDAQCGPYNAGLGIAIDRSEWAFHFTEQVSVSGAEKLDTDMYGIAVQMLALTDGLDMVSWTYPREDGSQGIRSLSADQAAQDMYGAFQNYNSRFSAMRPTLPLHSGAIGWYADSPSRFQMLHNVLYTWKLAAQMR